MQTRLELSRATSVEGNFPAPPGRSYFPYQQAGIAYALLGDTTLFADEPGLGKTIQVCGYINAKGIRTALIVCPASLVGNWKKELENWLVRKPIVEIFAPKTFGKNLNTEILIMSYSYASSDVHVQSVLKKFRYEFFCGDEIHNLKNPKAKRTKHVLAKNGLAHRAKYRHVLSGTPIVNRPIELYPIVKSLCPEAIDNADYFGYGIKYCKGWKSPWGWNFDGASNMKELGTRLRREFMVRRKKADVLKDLPDKLPPAIVYLNQDRATATLVKRMATFDADAVLSSGPKTNFEELSELRKELGIAKIESASEFIRTELESGHEKIIVFAHHKEVVKGLFEALKEFNPTGIVGDTVSAKRQQNVEKFQTDKTCRLFLGSISAAGVGHTLTASSYVIFVEGSYVPGENEQAIDRAHRIGQKECVQSAFLVHEGSLDERILQINLNKTAAMGEVYA